MPSLISGLVAQRLWHLAVNYGTFSCSQCRETRVGPFSAKTDLLLLRGATLMRRSGGNIFSINSSFLMTAGSMPVQNVGGIFSFNTFHPWPPARNVPVCGFPPQPRPSRYTFSCCVFAADKQQHLKCVPLICMDMAVYFLHFVYLFICLFHKKTAESA